MSSPLTFVARAHTETAKSCTKNMSDKASEMAPQLKALAAQARPEFSP